MRSPQFRGSGVALVTPFKNDKVDYQTLEQLIEHCIEGGVDYLVSLGTTGESVTLSSAECREVLSFTIKIVNERLPIVAGMFGGNNTRQLVERIQSFNFDGCAGILSSNPSYSKPSQKGIYHHYMAVADASPLPVIIYNVPGRTASNMSPETIVRLAKDNNKFVAVKEASGDLVQASKILKHAPDDFMVLSGDDPTALSMVACGGQGVISVIANAYPAPLSDMMRAALNGDLKTAKELHLALFDLHQWLYVEGNPVGIKAALEVMGLCTREVRLPLVAISDENFHLLRKEMRNIKKTLRVRT